MRVLKNNEKYNEYTNKLFLLYTNGYIKNDNG